jgi:hypothetical protein
MRPQETTHRRTKEWPKNPANRSATFDGGSRSTRLDYLAPLLAAIEQLLKPRHQPGPLRPAADTRGGMRSSERSSTLIEPQGNLVDAQHGRLPVTPATGGACIRRDRPGDAVVVGRPARSCRSRRQPLAPAACRNCRARLKAAAGARRMYDADSQLDNSARGVYATAAASLGHRQIPRPGRPSSPSMNRLSL